MGFLGDGGVEDWGGVSRGHSTPHYLLPDRLSVSMANSSMSPTPLTRLPDKYTIGSHYKGLRGGGEGIEGGGNGWDVGEMEWDL